MKLINYLNNNPAPNIPVLSLNFETKIFIFLASCANMYFLVNFIILFFKTILFTITPPPKITWWGSIVLIKDAINEPIDSDTSNKTFFLL